MSDQPVPTPDITAVLVAAAGIAEELSPDQVRRLLLTAAEVIAGLQQSAAGPDDTGLDFGRALNTA